MSLVLVMCPNTQQANDHNDEYKEPKHRCRNDDQEVSIITMVIICNEIDTKRINCFVYTSACLSMCLNEFIDKNGCNWCK